MISSLDREHTAQGWNAEAVASLLILLGLVLASVAAENTLANEINHFECCRARGSSRTLNMMASLSTS